MASITNSPFTWYNKGIKYASLTGMLTDDIKVALLTDTYTPNVTTHEFFDVSITGEVANGNGYTTGGQALTSKTLTESTPGTWVFKSANPLWTPTTGDLTANLWVLYNNTPSSSKPLLGFGYLNYNGGSPLNVITEIGYPLTILVSTNGWFQDVKVNGV